MKHRVSRSILQKLLWMLEYLKTDETVNKVPDWVKKIEDVIEIIHELI